MFHNDLASPEQPSAPSPWDTDVPNGAPVGEGASQSQPAGYYAAVRVSSSSLCPSPLCARPVQSAEHLQAPVCTPVSVSSHKNLLCWLPRVSGCVAKRGTAPGTCCAGYLDTICRRLEELADNPLWKAQQEVERMKQQRSALGCLSRPARLVHLLRKMPAGLSSRSISSTSTSIPSCASSHLYPNPLIQETLSCTIVQGSLIQSCNSND